jgi:hypothetical protein
MITTLLIQYRYIYKYFVFNGIEKEFKDKISKKIKEVAREKRR